MNVVIYARFSSHSQTEQSIEGQLKVCYEYAKDNDYIVVGEYIDRAQTGKMIIVWNFKKCFPTATNIPLRVCSFISLTVLHETVMTVQSTNQS